MYFHGLHILTQNGTILINVYRINPEPLISAYLVNYDKADG